MCSKERCRLRGRNIGPPGQRTPKTRRQDGTNARPRDPGLFLFLQVQGFVALKAYLDVARLEYTLSWMLPGYYSSLDVEPGGQLTTLCADQAALGT
jgi:hypothetical protein